MNDTTTAFATDLESRIERQYLLRGDRLGWRLLYSPAAVLAGASVAFIGLNPGGNSRYFGYPEFAMDAGSAYAVESWDGAAPGQSPLQRQVLALFARVNEPPEDVLAGNLVPFRSPSWGTLPDRNRALAFGKELWRDILAEVSPKLVIAMGREPFAALKDILKVRTTQSIELGWGTYCGERGNFADGRLIYLPHLSRFSLMSRPASQLGLEQLFVE